MDSDIAALTERVDAIRAVVGIIAPFGAATAEDRARNTLRALSLARLAARRGLAPIVPHGNIFLGVHGSDDNPADRDAGIASCAKMLTAIREAGGGVWGLTRDDGLMSDGGGLELKWFCGDGSSGYVPQAIVLTWPEWLAQGAVDPSCEAIAALARVEGLVAA